MAQSPRFKVYSSAGEYLAACVFPEDAATLVAARGNGTTIRDGHRHVLWVEGSEVQRASVSLAFVAHTLNQRVGLRYVRSTVEEGGASC